MGACLPSMIDHIGIRVRDFSRAKDFYVKVLGTLGFKLLMEFGPEVTGGGWSAGFGESRPDFWIGTTQPGGPGHVAFVARDRKAVAAFHKAALEAGGKDFGSPGPRPQYHKDYYGAFVLDPDG